MIPTVFIRPDVVAPPGLLFDLVPCADAGSPAISWASLRPSYASADAVMIQVAGVMCLVFGIGPRGAAWVDRLSRSRWFQGLSPMAEYLATSGGEAAGSIPAMRLAGIAGFLPEAPMATVAVEGSASPEDHAAALRLIRTLRQYRDRRGMRVTVVATVEHGHPNLAARLAQHGAFVIEAASGVPAQHLHHFPLRAAVRSRFGRLVCADLADHLATWRPGTRSCLHLVPVDLLGEHPSGGIFTSTDPLTDMAGWADLLLAT